MKLPRRQFLHLPRALPRCRPFRAFAWAQAYPTRPVPLSSAFPPGGAPESSRARRSGLSERLGQQFIIENRPGAGSNIGTEAVVSSPADGYTLLLVVRQRNQRDALRKLNFNFIRDIAPVA